MTKISTLTDNFSRLDTVKWSNWSTNASVDTAAGELDLIPTNSYSGFISSVDRYDITGSHFGAHVTRVASMSTGSSAGTIIKVQVDANNFIELVWIQTNSFVCRVREAGVDDATYPGVPVGTTHMRISVAADRTITWESWDGTTWTAGRTGILAPAAWDLTQMQAIVQAGYWSSSDSGPTSARITSVGIYVEAPAFTIGTNTDILFGAGTPNSPGDSDLAELETATGRAPTVELWYRRWTQTITVGDLDLVRDRGHVSELTWEAFDVDGATNTTYNYSTILAGNFDTYITDTATTLRDWGHPIYLRLFHEMNGDWYPWGVGVNGNTAQQHIDSWNYVRNIFLSVGATNVKWVWSPNTSFTGSAPYEDIYPGDKSVDLVAINGYNWGDGTGLATNPDTTWRTPQQVFEASFHEMRALTSTKPFWIGETGSAEAGGSKAEWIDVFIKWLTNQPEVECFVWSHHSKERDWRISSSTAASDSFKNIAASLTVPLPRPKIHSLSSGSFQVEWEPVEGSLTYDVEVDGVVVATATTARSFTSTGHGAFTLHDIRVRAGAGAWSSIVTVRTDQDSTTAHAGDVVTAWTTAADQSVILQRSSAITWVPEVSSSNPTITVDSSQEFQVMEGFGASMTDSSAWLIGTKLTPRQRDAALRALFAPDSGSLSFLRQPIGGSDFVVGPSYTYDDMPSGQTDATLANFSIAYDEPYIIPTLKRALAINPNIFVMHSPWSAPAWMKDSGSLVGGTLLAEYQDEYANYFLKFIQAYRAAGIPVDAVTVQNEPDNGTASYPCMYLTAAQELAFVRDHLGPTLAGTTRIVVHDHNWDIPQRPLDILADATAKSYIDGVAWHGYAGDVSVQGTVHDENPTINTYFTEVTGHFDAPDWGSNLRWAIRNLGINGTKNWAKTVISWNLALDKSNGPSNGPMNCRGVITVDQDSGEVSFNEEYVWLSHLARFIKPGAVRIGVTDASVSPARIYAAAFRNPDGTRAVVVLNDGSAMQTIRIKERGRQVEFIMPVGVSTFTYK